jgi:hypothetical protein
MELLTPDFVNAVLNQADLIKRARVFEGSTQKPFLVQSLTLTLTTAKDVLNPLRIGFSFRSLFVQSATDTTTNVNIQIGGPEPINSVFNVKKNDVWSSEYPINECNISWDAQSGKTITLVFFVDAEFKSGSLINQISGGVSVSNGTAFATALVAGVATAVSTLFASASTRLNGLVQNRTGGSIYIGGTSSVNNTAGNANRGFELQDGQDFTYKNTAALYAYCDATGDIICVTES